MGISLDIIFLKVRGQRQSCSLLCIMSGSKWGSLGWWWSSPQLQKKKENIPLWEARVPTTDKHTKWSVLHTQHIKCWEKNLYVYFILSCLHFLVNFVIEKIDLSVGNNWIFYNWFMIIIALWKLNEKSFSNFWNLV